MSDDPDQDYFADGISEDLITGLSRIRWLFVIARNSTFVYKHRAVDVRQVSRELGVRYVLEGSVRRAGNRLRISAQLVDAMTAAITGRSATTGSSATSSPCRTKSPAASLLPSSPTCWRRRASVPFAFRRRPRRLGARGPRANALLAPDALGLRGGGRAAQAGRGSLSGLRAGSEPVGVRLVFAAHMGWIDREPDLLRGPSARLRAIALDDRDPWGHIALGYGP